MQFLELQPNQRFQSRRRNLGFGQVQTLQPDQWLQMSQPDIGHRRTRQLQFDQRRQRLDLLQAGRTDLGSRQVELLQGLEPGKSLEIRIADRRVFEAESLQGG